jgi:hypothetical protein
VDSAAAPSGSGADERVGEGGDAGGAATLSPLPGPCSSGRAMNAVRSPAAAAAARSDECAATIIDSSGRQSKAAADAR